MYNVVLVEQGNYLGRGQEYVGKLCLGLERFLPDYWNYRFHILTDRTNINHPAIQVHPLPEGVEGWWSKLALFMPGQFTVGDQIIYFDLDTIPVGSLDDLVQTCANNAGMMMLRDLYYPERKASGIMSWRAGTQDHIWTMWDTSGRPTFHPEGDGRWIEQLSDGAACLQDFIPGQIVSYKKHCKKGVPEGARVVCFHGQPRPHMVPDDPLIKKFWS